MSEAIYILCALTSLICAILLLRGYVRSKTRLLLWTSICFIGLLANNVMLFIDKVLYPVVDVLVWQRAMAALAGVGILLFGLIWDSE
jgi:CHASE2 domain-containing sensor protein